MKYLVDLEPQFVQLGTNSLIHIATIEDAHGICFLCPMDECGHMIICWFKGKVPSSTIPGPGRWTPSGTGYADFTLKPSVHLSGHDCGWHGFVTNGEVTTV